MARFAEVYFRHELGVAVATVPLSEFLAEQAPLPGHTLILISQELSHNAHLALDRAGAFAHALLITSVAADDPQLAAFRAHGGQVWTLPPGQERGFLVRVMGPLTAALGLCRWGTLAAGRGLPSSLAEVPVRVGAALEAGFALAERWPSDVRRAPLVACGWYARALELISWSWMEAWWVEQPPVWDVLQLAHGPWQALFATPSPLLLLRRPDDAPELWERLAQMVNGPGVPPRELVELTATLPGGLAFFEHTAAVLGLLAGVMAKGPGDLKAWPGKGTDGPLYELER